MLEVVVVVDTCWVPKCTSFDAPKHVLFGAPKHVLFDAPTHVSFDAPTHVSSGAPKHVLLEAPKHVIWRAQTRVARRALIDGVWCMETDERNADLASAETLLAKWRYLRVKWEVFQNILEPARRSVELTTTCSTS